MADTDNPVLEISRKPFDETFGNYFLHGISEVELPSSIAWWPETTAWKVLAGVMLLLLLRYAYTQLQQWKQNAYRREAIKRLSEMEQQWKNFQSLDTLLEVPLILKASALAAYPRSNIAMLSNHEWLQFLNMTASKLDFKSTAGEHLLQISYQPTALWRLSNKEIEALFKLVRQWIATHKVNSEPSASLAEPLVFSPSLLKDQ